MKQDFINKVVASFFKGYDKDFVNEKARLLGLYGDQFKINNKKRLAMYLAHVKAEVDVGRNGVVKMREGMHYSVERLPVVFKRFRKKGTCCTPN